MNQSFFIGALGAHQQQKSLNVTSNNLANINTQGFKGERSRFASLMYQDLKNADNGQVRSGTGTHVLTTDTNFRHGGGMTTGRPQDYMIEGDGFFALADLQTGEISLTRVGAFSMASKQEQTGEFDEEGNPIMELIYYLSDGQGRFVMGKDGNMIKMTDPNEKLEVGVFDYINYNGMEHKDQTRFIPVDKNGGLMRGTGVAVNGMLEASNVDLAEEMTKVIESQRAYSMALKMMTTSDEIESTINSLRG